MGLKGFYKKKKLLIFKCENEKKKIDRDKHVLFYKVFYLNTYGCLIISLFCKYIYILLLHILIKTYKKLDISK